MEPSVNGLSESTFHPFPSAWDLARAMDVNINWRGEIKSRLSSDGGDIDRAGTIYRVQWTGIWA